MGNSDNDEEYKQSKVEASEEEFVEEEEQKPTKKQKTEKSGEKRKRDTTSSDNNQENKTFELSAKRRVTVRLFSTGEPSVDIREFYKDKTSGEMRPGKAGICFPLAQWNKLKELMPDIDEAVEAIKK